MRWLVTGGLGFIGSHFIRLALRERPPLEVVNLDAMTYAETPPTSTTSKATRATTSSRRISATPRRYAQR